MMIGRAARLQSEAGDNLTARQVLRDARRDLARLDDANRRKGLLALITVGASLGDLDEALDAIEAIEDAHADWRSEAIIAVFQVSEYAITQAKNRVIPRSIKLLETIPDTTERATAGVAIVQAQAALNDFDTALSTARNLAGPGDPVTAQGQISLALVAIAEAQSRFGLKLASRKVANEAFRNARDLAGDELLRTEIFLQIVDLQCKLGDLDGAARTTDALVLPFGKAEGIARLGRALANAGRQDEAKERLYAAMAIREAIGPGEAQEVPSLSMGLRAQDAVGHALVSANLIDEARAYVERTGDPAWRAKARTELFTFLRRADESDAERAKSALAMEDIRMKQVYLMELARMQSQSGKLATLLDWVEQIDSPGLRAVVLAEAARGR